MYTKNSNEIFNSHKSLSHLPKPKKPIEMQILTGALFKNIHLPK